jgi:hypothetical protein
VAAEGRKRKSNYKKLNARCTIQTTTTPSSTFLKFKTLAWHAVRITRMSKGSRKDPRTSCPHVSLHQRAGSVNSLQVRANHAATLEADIQPTLIQGFTLRRRVTAKSPCKPLLHYLIRRFLRVFASRQPLVLHQLVRFQAQAVFFHGSNPRHAQLASSSVH